MPWRHTRCINLKIGVSLPYSGFPGGSEGKESACNAGDPRSIPGLGRFPGEGNGNPLQYSCLEISHGQRSLAGYSPWGHKETGLSERQDWATHTFTFLPYNVVLVSAVQQSESVTWTYIPSPSWTALPTAPPHPSRSLRSTELSSLLFAAGSH